MIRKVKDLTGLIAELKPRLRDYLVKVGTEFSSNGDKFQCPNRENHANNDETPSCGFYPTDESWHCFVCQENGTIFRAAHFLDDKPEDGPDWGSQNVEYLAKLLGIEYDYADLSEDEQLQYQTYEALQVTAELTNGGVKVPKIQEYIKSRGWTNETVQSLQLGYCNYDKLIQVLTKRGYSHEVLMRAGLVNKTLLDKRLLFPVKDVRGRVVGFAGRSLLSKEDCHRRQIQRYVNSQSSAVYKKSESLYNIHNIKVEDVLIVEGYADVVSLYQQGAKNVIGLGGVAFTEDHLQVLIKKGIKTITLCLDNDEEGRRSEERILNQITPRHGLSVCVKDRDECEDPDACIQKHDFILKSGTTSLFDHYLNRHVQSGDKKDRDKALRSILLERSPIDRDHLCKKMSKTLKVRVEVIVEEVDFLIDKEGDTHLVNMMDLVKETQTFERQLFDFDKRAWSRGPLLGLATGFPILTRELDGIQNRFYIVAGEEGTGKSAFVRMLISGMLKASEGKIFVLYISIDDTISAVVSRFLALETGLEINAMENPKWKIQENEHFSPEDRVKYLERRQNALKRLHDLTTSFVIKDESTIRDIKDIERAIRTFKELAGDRQLVVFVDSLHRIRQVKKFHETARDQAMEVSNSLKTWCSIYDVPIIATAELRKLNTPEGKPRRPVMDDIKEAGDFKFDADVVMLMYNDMKAHGRSPTEAKLKWQWELGSIEWFPIVEIFVAKNKTSVLNHCLYYKFLPMCSKMIEATQEEQMRYRHDAFDND